MCKDAQDLGLASWRKHFQMKMTFGMALLLREKSGPQGDWVLDEGAYRQRTSWESTMVDGEALVPLACHRRPGAS